MTCNGRPRLLAPDRAAAPGACVRRPGGRHLQPVRYALSSGAARRRARRRLPGDGRLLHRQRRAADIGRRPARVPGRRSSWSSPGTASTYALLLVVGGRLGDAFGRQAAVPRRHGGLHADLAALRARADAPAAGRRAGAAGRGRRADGAAGARHHPGDAPTGHHRPRAIGLFGATGGIAAVVGQLARRAAGLRRHRRQPAGGRSSWSTCRSGSSALALARALLPETRSLRPAPADVPGTVSARRRRARGAGAADARAARSAGRCGPGSCSRRRRCGPPRSSSLVERPSASRHGRGPAGAAVAAAAPQHAPRAAARRAVLRRLRRLHVRLRVVGAGRARLEPRSRPGLALTPMAAAFFVASLLMPRLVARFGRYRHRGGCGPPGCSGCSPSPYDLGDLAAASRPSRWRPGSPSRASARGSRCRR